ncbi:MAG: SymE family type I addiction module toxin [Lachnospiraceae bacterium]|nr:SymE family type I addiction module toxin [Lachnospiraceae bacterium]
MKKQKNIRNLKVYDQCGYRYQSTPTITLKGLWLRELGFDSNTLISVKCENGRLVIEPREPQEERIITTVIRNGVSMVAEDRVVYR